MAAVLVHIDLDGDRPHPSSLVALAAGRQVASSWGATLYAALIAQDDRARAGAAPQAIRADHVPGMEAIERALAAGGADKIVVALTDGTSAPLWASVGGAWQGVVDHLRPRLVMFGADAPAAPELAPRTGARIGARLLMRARTVGGDEVELRDRDGGYVRASDGGAAVAMIGRAEPVTSTGSDDEIDIVVLAVPGGSDPAVELAGSSPAEVSQTAGVLIAIGDDVARNRAVVASARTLARLLGGQLVASAATRDAVQPGAVVERSTPLAPDLLITVGASQLEVGGATSIIRIGSKDTKLVDGALPGAPDVGLAELVKRLEDDA